MREMSIQEIKKCSFEILLWFKSFCEQNELRFFLCGGTLLGAVRHNGFIPWDDDIDIMMPRSDYERMKNLFPKENKYELYSPLLTKNYTYSFSKIIDSRTIKEESSIRDKAIRIGVDIDVFPIDNLPSDDSECIRYYRRIGIIDLWLFFMSSSYSKGKTFLSSALRNLGIFVARLAEFLHIDSIDKVLYRFDRLSQKYNKVDCQFCGITSIGHYGIRERNLKIGYESSVFVGFEGALFPAPESYSNYLAQLYGKDYMQIPPIDKRATHHSFRAYWK